MQPSCPFILLPGGESQTYGAGKTQETRNPLRQQFSSQLHPFPMSNQQRRRRVIPSATIITAVRNNTSCIGQKHATASPNPKVTACIPRQRANLAQASLHRIFPIWNRLPFRTGYSIVYKYLQMCAGFPKRALKNIRGSRKALQPFGNPWSVRIRLYYITRTAWYPSCTAVRIFLGASASPTTASSFTFPSRAASSSLLER